MSTGRQLLFLSALALCTLFAGFPLPASAQTVTDLCTPKIIANKELVTPAQRKAAGNRAWPPLTDAADGFAWPDTELGVAKIGDRYVLPENGLAGDAVTPKSHFSTLRQFVHERTTAGVNLTVLKTRVGSAQSVAVAIDAARWPEVVGTISGDDTIFIATAGAREQAQLGERLRDIFGI